MSLSSFGSPRQVRAGLSGTKEHQNLSLKKRFMFPKDLLSVAQLAGMQPAGSAHAALVARMRHPSLPETLSKLLTGLREVCQRKAAIGRRLRPLDQSNLDKTID